MTAGELTSSYVLTISCPDRTGIVAAITGFIAESGGLITEAAHFVDEYSDRSFMRTSFRGSTLPPREQLTERFAKIAARFQMEWQLHDATSRCRGRKASPSLCSD